MSDLNIQLNLRATDKGLIGTVNKTTKALKSLNSTIEKITTTTSNSSKAMRVFRTQAYALGGALGIFSVFRQYTTIVSGFGQALADLSAITRATGQDLAFYREEAINLGLTTTQSASEIVNAFKLVGSAKPELLENREALASVTRQVLLLAEASGLDMANATNVAVTALNQFGQGADEANRFVNVLAAGAKFGASEIPQMGAALREAGVFAANANVSFEQTNALLQLLAQHGIEGAQAGTALRNVLEILESSSNNELIPSLVGVSTALENLKAQQLSTTEITKLFGNENINAAQGLVQLQDQIDPLTSKLTGTDIALEQANIRTNTLSGDLTKLSNVYTTLVASFDSSDGAFSDVVQKLTEMDGVAGENSEIIQQLISSATQLAVVLKGWKAITEISGYITSYTVAAEGATLVTRGLLRALPGIGLALVVTEGMSAYLDYLYEVKKAQEEAAEANRKLVQDFVTLSVKRYKDDRPKLERNLATQREIVRTLREDAEKKENTRVRGILSYTRKEFNDAKAKLDGQILVLQVLLKTREELNKADQNSTIVNESENDGPSINRFDEKITEVEDYAGRLNLATRQIVKSGQELDRSNARNRRALNRSLEQPFVGESSSPSNGLEAVDFTKEAELSRLQGDYDQRQELLIKAREEELILQQEYDEKALELSTRRSLAETRITEEAEKTKFDLRVEYGTRIAGSVSSLFGELASLQDKSNKDQFNKWKELATAQAIIGTSLAIVQASAESVPFYVKAVLISLAAATGAVQIAKIQGTRYNPSAREFGGGISFNKPYLVGERGPEIIVPSSAGTVINNRSITDATSSATSRPVINVNVVNNAPVDVSVREDNNGDLSIFIDQLDDAFGQRILQGNSEIGRAINTNRQFG